MGGELPGLSDEATIGDGQAAMARAAANSSEKTVPESVVKSIPPVIIEQAEAGADGQNTVAIIDSQSS